MDRTEQLDAILKEWMPIFQKFKNTKPDIAAFLEHFGQNIRSSTMTLRPLSGEDLVEAARSTKASSPSLDNWKPSAITALAFWFPMVFNDLALILNQVEEVGEWPSG